MIPIITTGIYKDIQNYTDKENSLHGHSLSLHVSFLVVLPVQVPPLASSMILDRVLNLVPVPHSAEQRPTAHSLHSQCIPKI